ncbi:TonB-dependent receptor [Spongiibacter sp. KMU-158]|uniref:TonB-dependent receptor n=1 Tax=Spongiibacter pelagi TaxID=2760804 RepID=A0A927GVP5_9GAMM|nr:TonB-dependent receptor [Spongiibacter pelagi]MBD2858886.1 TonB-dependent receptor [Spongiibacter pelagi]
MRVFKSTSAFAAVVSLFCSDVLAQNPAPVKNRLIEEVIVTSQKREQDVQDVPLAVLAFSGDRLDAMGITEQTDLQRITPGLNVTSQVSYVVTFLRGVGTDAVTAADPSVATYIDDIYYPFASNLAQNFGAVERIEVLKGPQGTLFGRNATGGAINVHTKDPDFDEFYGEFLSNRGSYNYQLDRLYTNIPITDSFAINLSAMYQVTDLLYEGTRGLDKDPFPKDRTRGYRIKARWQPSDYVDINLATFKLRLNGAGANVAFNADPSELGRLNGIEAQTGYKGSIDAPVYTQTEDNTVYYGDIKLNTPWFDIKLVGSDQRMDTAGVRDFDGSPEAISTFDTPSQYIDAQSAEIQLLSNGESGPSWMQWIVGGYYFEGVNGFETLNFIVNGIDLGAGQLAGIQLPDAFTNILNQANVLGVDGAINLSGLTGTDSYAFFAQTTFTLTDWLDITLGARQQVEEKYIYRSTVGLNNQDGSQTQIADNSNRATDSDGNPHPARDEQKSFSPKVSFEFRPLEQDMLFYLSWQEAVKSAAYNTVAIYDEPDYVAQEEITAWELGMKSTFFDGTVRFNAAVFDYDLANLQTPYISLFAGGVIAFQNAGAAKIRGAEFDGMVVLLPKLIDNLVLSGGMSYLDSEYLDFDNASGFDDDGNFQEDLNFTGNQVIRSPEVSGNIALSKTWGLSNGEIETTIDAYYTDSFYYEPSNRQNTVQDEYWLVGARVSFLYSPWDLRITGSVKNLLDEFYTNGIFVTDYGVQPSLAPPRTYSVQAVVNF